MSVAESPVMIPCGGGRMVGIVHVPERQASVGVVIVVGGPQYRVGSHRQFLLMARDLAAAGIPVLRFDCRGMGDSEGQFPGFEYIEDDIRAAVDAFFAHQPGLAKIVLWGLCDSSTACMFYGHKDPRVAGMVLTNPWVRTEAGLARTHLRHYYVQRIFAPDLWRNILGGKFKPGASLASLLGTIRNAIRPAKPEPAKRGPATAEMVSLAELGLGDSGLPDRTLKGLEAFKKPVLFVLSGNDLTAREFVDLVRASRGWRRAMGAATVTRRDLPEADHTFSTRAHLDEATRLTLDWVGRL
jgi:exosortase A-associated hydrolase 1